MRLSVKSSIYRTLSRAVWMNKGLLTGFVGRPFYRMAKGRLSLKEPGTARFIEGIVFGRHIRFGAFRGPGCAAVASNRRRIIRNQAEKENSARKFIRMYYGLHSCE